MINEIQSYGPVIQNRATGKTTDSQEQGDVFKNILKEATENAGGKETAESNALLSELSEISSIQPMDIEASQGSLQHQTEKLLSQLEQYSNQLDDPKVTLKEMSTFLHDIVSNTQELIHDTESMEEGNTQEDVDTIKDIAFRMSIDAQKELIKIDRGDYL